MGLLQQSLQDQFQVVRWTRKKSNNLLLLEGKDLLHLPMSDDERALELSDYSFIATNDGQYIMKATVNLGITCRVYQLKIRLHQDPYKVECRVLECGNGKCQDALREHLGLGLLLGDQLFRALCSPEGTKGYQQYIELSPYQLLELWTDFSQGQLITP